MKRRLLAMLIVGVLGLLVATSGCGKEDKPGGKNTKKDTDMIVGDGGMDAADGAADTSPIDADDQDTIGATDTAVDSGTDTTADTMGADAGDGGGDGDAGPPTCDFMGISEGVCSMGVPGGNLPDAGLGDGGMMTDGGTVCGEPMNWEKDESSCDGVDNDCDGITDEGCDCDFLGRSDGVCSKGTIAATDGNCEPPQNYEKDEATCDAKDNDCDGVEDEECRCLYMSSSKGVCGNAQISPKTGKCAEPNSYASNETNSHCDSKDNDCDGKVDENCTCTSGESESCYTGPTGTAGVGICKQGTRTCDSMGNWGSCMNEQTPKQKESCDSKDNDCDGTVDEGCQCNYQQSSDGVCQLGTIGPNGNCTQPGTYQNDETKCDGADNDCDGVVDENCPCAYNMNNTGVCGNATIDPSTGNCAEPSDYESPEASCDSKDNDCDGDVDGADSDLSCGCTAGSTQSCYTGPSGTAGTGICSQGTKTCDMNGNWGSCMGETTPGTEGGGTNCDGKDNDCDGATDEGCTCDYNMKSAGVCQNQTRDTSGSCPEPNAYESTESTCTDSLDNDCDTNTDCADSDCSGKACGTGTGATCQNQQCAETSCKDGNDNDQDGQTDCLDSDCTYCGSGAMCDASGNCHEQNCQDGKDNDGDGDTDCQDSECSKRQCDSSNANRTCCPESSNTPNLCKSPPHSVTCSGP